MRTGRIYEIGQVGTQFDGPGHIGMQVTMADGSVQDVTAQLINVADGLHLWSQTYDREVMDILTVQTEVAQQVVQTLQMKLGVEATRALAKTQTENPEAHRPYLLGR